MNGKQIQVGMIKSILYAIFTFLIVYVKMYYIIRVLRKKWTR